MALEWINVFDLVDAADIAVEGDATKNVVLKRFELLIGGILAVNYGGTPCAVFGGVLRSGGSLTLPSGYTYSGRVRATVEESLDGAGGYGVYVYGLTAYDAEFNTGAPTVFVEDEACVDEGLTVYLHFGAGYDAGFGGLFAVRFEVEAEPATPPEFWTDLVSVRALT